VVRNYRNHPISEEYTKPENEHKWGFQGKLFYSVVFDVLVKIEQV
jgi:hypothetical protein